MPQLALQLVLAAALGLALAAVYVRCGKTLANRRRLAQNFLLLAVTTTLVISIVKSSLTLSLGLVGALSIVRFRAAIKEPEELVYLFLAISLGLGLGAGQILVTILAFVIIALIVLGHHGWRRKAAPPNLYVTLHGPSGPSLAPTALERLLAESGLEASLQRYEAGAEKVEASFRVQAPSSRALEQTLTQLQSVAPGVHVSCLTERDAGD